MEHPEEIVLRDKLDRVMDDIYPSETPVSKEFNEYWVAEDRYPIDETTWRSAFAFYVELDLAMRTVDQNWKHSSCATRIVHYTGTGASVVAEWDAEGKRVK